MRLQTPWPQQGKFRKFAKICALSSQYLSVCPHKVTAKLRKSLKRILTEFHLEFKV